MRYRNIFSLVPNQYCPGAPVIIAAGALLADSQSNHMIAQLKLRNISDRTILAAKVLVTPMDSFGQAVGTEVEYQYLDQRAARNDDFGTHCAILLPPGIRSFRVRVVKLLFSDNTVWQGGDGEWVPLSVPVSLARHYENPDLVRQFQLTFPEPAQHPCQFYPAKKQDLWQCACGCLNHGNEAACFRCGRSLDEMTAISTEQLTEALNIRLEEEAAAQKKLEAELEAARLKAERELEEQRQLALAQQEEARRKAAEDREKYEEELRRVQTQQRLKAAERARHTKKILAITIPIVLVVAIAIVVGLKVYLPERKYTQAVALYEAGNREEAISIFAEIGDYKDTQDFVFDYRYEQALGFIEAGSYSDALTILETMPDYRDVSRYLPFLQGWTLLQDKRYTEAVEIFSAMTHEDFSYIGVGTDLLYEAMYLAARDGDGIMLEEAMGLLEQLPDDYESKSVNALQDNYDYWLRRAGTYVQMEDNLRYELNISFMLRDGDVAPVVEYSFFNGTFSEDATIKKLPSHIVEGTSFRSDCCISTEGSANGSTYQFRFYLNGGTVCITCPQWNSEYYAYKVS